jgi:hypothetical protein
MITVKGIPFKTGNGSKGFNVVANEIAARAIGRATAQIDNIISVERTIITDSTGKQFHAHVATYKNGERRTSVWHSVTAELGKGMILDYNAATNTFSYALDHNVDSKGNIVPGTRTATVPQAWADGKTHLAVSTFVEGVNPDTGERNPMRLSRGSFVKQYWRFHTAQMQAKIGPSNPLYVNPIAHWPKDTWAQLLFLYRQQQGAIALKHDGNPEKFFAVMEQFATAESAAN